MIYFYILALILFFPLFSRNPGYTIALYVLVIGLHYSIEKHLQRLRNRAAKSIISKRYVHFPSEEDIIINKIPGRYGFYHQYYRRETGETETFLRKHENLAQNHDAHPFFCNKCNNFSWQNKFGSKGRVQGCYKCNYFKPNYITTHQSSNR